MLAAPLRWLQQRGGSLLTVVAWTARARLTCHVVRNIYRPPVTLANHGLNGPSAAESHRHFIHSPGTSFSLRSVVGQRVPPHALPVIGSKACVQLGGLIGCVDLISSSNL